MKKKIAKKRFKSDNVSNEIKFLTNGTMVDVNTLKLWEDNPRYNKEAVAPLAKLFKRHGVRSSIVVWTKNNVIYKGNTTFKALLLLGCKQVPVDFQDFPSETAAKAYGIADNKSSEFAQWDDDILLELMKAEDMIPHKESTGFKEVEIERLAKAKDKNKIDGTSEHFFKCVVSYHPSIKDELKSYLAKTVAKKFGDKLVIKFI